MDQGTSLSCVAAATSCVSTPRNINQRIAALNEFQTAKLRFQDANWQEEAIEAKRQTQPNAAEKLP